MNCKLVCLVKCSKSTSLSHAGTHVYLSSFKQSHAKDQGFCVCCRKCHDPADVCARRFLILTADLVIHIASHKKGWGSEVQRCSLPFTTHIGFYVVFRLAKSNLSTATQHVPIVLWRHPMSRQTSRAPSTHMKVSYLLCNFPARNTHFFARFFGAPDLFSVWAICSSLGRFSKQYISYWALCSGLRRY